MVCKYLQSGEVKNCGKKRKEELWQTAEKYKLQMCIFNLFHILYNMTDLSPHLGRGLKIGQSSFSKICLFVFEGGS